MLHCRILATEDAVIQDMRSGIQDTYDTKNITVDGINGVEYIPNSDSGTEERTDVYFVKGDTLYDIHLTNPTNVDQD